MLLNGAMKEMERQTAQIIFEREIISSCFKKKFVFFAYPTGHRRRFIYLSTCVYKDVHIHSRISLKEWLQDYVHTFDFFIN